MEKLDGRYRIGQLIITRRNGFNGIENLVSVITAGSYVNSAGVSQYVCTDPESGNDRFRGSADELDAVIESRNAPLDILNTEAQALVKRVREDAEKRGLNPPEKYRTIQLTVVDGGQPETVRIVEESKLAGWSCADDKHCATHGNGPFFCCRCGAVFERVDDEPRKGA